HAEDEQVDRIRQQHQSHHHLEGTGAKHEPYAGSAQYADRQREKHLHQGVSVVAASADRGRWARIDWCASAVRISSVAPTTTASTARSKKAALGRCTSPISGSDTCAVWVVRNGKPITTATSPVVAPSSSPAAIQRAGRRFARASTQRAPETSDCSRKAM